jgi:hypothetical protein
MGDVTWGAPGGARDELADVLKRLDALLPKATLDNGRLFYNGRAARALVEQARAIVKEDLKVRVVRRGERVFGPLTEAQEALAIHLHHENMNDAQIALELGTSGGNVSRVIHEYVTGVRRDHWPLAVDMVRNNAAFCTCAYHRPPKATTR